MLDIHQNEYVTRIHKVQDYIEENYGENQFLTLYNDNPEFGKEEQFRTSLCMTFPESCSAKEDGQLGVMTIDGGFFP